MIDSRVSRGAIARFQRKGILWTLSSLKSRELEFPPTSFICATPKCLFVAHRRFDPGGDTLTERPPVFTLTSVRYYLALRFRYPFTPRAVTRSRGNRGKISFSVDWTTGEIRGVSYTIDQQRDKDMGRSGRLVFSSIQRRRVVFLHTFRGIGAFLFVKFPIRAAAPTRIPGVQKRFKTTRGEQSQPLSHRMFGANTLVCRRNVAIGRE